jgi:hypothetical protein
MRVTTVESPTLAAVGYDETQQLLQLEFCSQAVYVYFGVPAAVQQVLLEAPSKGAYFNRAIRAKTRMRRCPRSVCACRWTAAHSAPAVPEQSIRYFGRYGTHAMRDRNGRPGPARPKHQRLLMGDH